jgi:hypothetical protein
MNAMSRADWILISLMVTGGAGAFAVNLLWMEMVDLLNEKLPENRLSYYSSTPWGIAARYATVHPHSMRPQLVRIFMGVSALCFALIIVMRLSRR